MAPDPILWQKISVTLPLEYEERATALLTGFDSKGLWVEGEAAAVRLHLFFPQLRKGDPGFSEKIRKLLSEQIPEEKITLSVALLPEEDWQTAWQVHSVKKQRIGRTLLVVPEWEESSRNESKRVVRISPGMAFGTGTHPTTRQCLLFLEASLLRRPGSVLDVGTGSGILAIAAVKLGARATAVENDPVALEAAKENARINRVASKIFFRETIPKRRYRVVVANLTGPVLLSLYETISRRVENGGRLILSGMLKEEAKGVLQTYRERFSLIRSQRIKEWVTLMLKKNGTTMKERPHEGAR